MSLKEAPLLCKYTSVTHKEALVSPVIKKCIFVILIYYFVPHKIFCASHQRCHGATLCDSLLRRKVQSSTGVESAWGRSGVESFTSARQLKRRKIC